jgi:hypothetical protein
MHVATGNSIQEATALAQAEAAVNPFNTIQSGVIPSADLRAQLVGQLETAPQDFGRVGTVPVEYDSDNEYWRDS